VRQSSSTAEGLVDSLFGNPAVDAAVSDPAWLQAMLDVEAGLAQVESDAGLIPAAAAAEIVAACRAELFDLADIGQRSLAAGNPAAPLARALTEAVSAEAQPYVHLGATSQDIIDTAMSLMAQRVLDVVLEDLAAVASACATLADDHRTTLMTARTLLQPALPTTFGLEAAIWLSGIDAARVLVTNVRFERLAVQLGGAAGTLASLRGRGVDVVHRLAEHLGLAEPVVPWHTDRTRLAELAAALGITCGVLGKMARDITLLAQAEVAEVVEGEGSDHGTSSTLPQKRNPVRSVLIIAAAERAPGLVSTAFHTLVQEHERAAGAWHAEWETIRALLRITGGACHHAVALSGSLRVNATRMKENLASDGGLMMAENLAHRLSQHISRSAANDIVRRCTLEAIEHRVAFAQVLKQDADVRRHLTEQQIVDALEPAEYLGSIDELIQRAHDAHRAVGGQS
jgi:3-carboxy-cis,cis-muconate cycloisomerase